MKWEKLPKHPSSPGPRWGHSCNTVDGGRFVYVFGGFDGLNNLHTNKVHVFDPGMLFLLLVKSLHFYSVLFMCPSFYEFVKF